MMTCYSSVYCLIFKFVAPSRRYLWIFFRSRLTLCKCVFSASNQRSWQIRNYPGCQRGFFFVAKLRLRAAKIEVRNEKKPSGIQGNSKLDYLVLAALWVFHLNLTSLSPVIVLIRQIPLTNRVRGLYCACQLRTEFSPHRRGKKNKHP